MASEQLRRTMSTLQALTLETACTALRDGLGVAFPTPCGYGWALDPFHETSVARVGLLKPNRSQPVGLIAGDLDQVNALVRWGNHHERWLRCWPAELSLILPGKRPLPELICSSKGGVSIRIPEGSQARALALQFGAALTATSLNRSGEVPASSPVHLQSLPAGAIAGYLPGQAGTGAPSTLVDLVDAPPRVLRNGSFNIAHMLEPQP